MGSVCLIDSNVLVYAVDRREPEKRERALALLQALWTGGTGALSTQTLGEFIAVTTRRMPDPPSLADIHRQVVVLANTFTVYDVTLPIVLDAARAARDHQMSYWDAQVWATAKLNQIPRVLTEDIPGYGSLEGVRFINPFADAFDLTSLT